MTGGCIFTEGGEASDSQATDLSQLGFLSNWHKIEKMLPKHRLLGKSVGMFLINDWCGRSQHTMGSATLGQVVLSYTKKQAEQAMKSKPISVVFPWSLYQFLPWVLALTSLNDSPWHGSVSQKYLFPPQVPFLFWSLCFITELKTETWVINRGPCYESQTRDRGEQFQG